TSTLVDDPASAPATFGAGHPDTWTSNADHAESCAVAPFLHSGTLSNTKSQPLTRSRLPASDVGTRNLRDGSAGRPTVLTLLALNPGPDVLKVLVIVPAAWINSV